MLKEWIRNIPLEMLLRIVGDTKVRGMRIWGLACAELARRGGGGSLAA